MHYHDHQRSAVLKRRLYDMIYLYIVALSFHAFGNQSMRKLAVRGSLAKGKGWVLHHYSPSLSQKWNAASRQIHYAFSREVRLVKFEQGCPCNSVFNFRPRGWCDSIQKLCNGRDACYVTPSNSHDSWDLRREIPLPLHIRGSIRDAINSSSGCLLLFWYYSVHVRRGNIIHKPGHTPCKTQYCANYVSKAA